MQFHDGLYDAPLLFKTGRNGRFSRRIIPETTGKGNNATEPAYVHALSRN
jgi:hypothetical protein